MIMVAQVDSNWGIAKGDKQLFHIPKDLAFFRALTLHNIVIMGGRTYREIGVLPDRLNIVLSRSLDQFESNLERGLIIANSEYACRAGNLFSVNPWEDCSTFVIGGGEIYKIFEPWCSQAILTRVAIDGNADTYMPNLELGDWELAECYPLGSVSLGSRLSVDMYRELWIRPTEWIAVDG